MLQFGLEMIIDLPPQILKVDIHHIRMVEHIIVPDMFGDLCAGQHTIRLTHQALEDGIFLGGQFDRFAASLDPPRESIQGQIPDLQHGAIGGV